MRLLPDGALDTAWKLFEEAFEILIIESSHAVKYSSNEQRNSMGNSFGCFPSPPSLHLLFPWPSRGIWRQLRDSCLSPNSSRSPRTQRGIFCEAFQDPKMIMDVSSGSAKRMLFPAPGSAGSPLLTPRATLWPVLFCCSAQLLEVLMLI